MYRRLITVADDAVVKSYDYMYSNANMMTNVVDNASNVTKYEYDRWIVKVNVKIFILLLSSQFQKSTKHHIYANAKNLNRC
jgi:hypothetical protein